MTWFLSLLKLQSLHGLIFHTNRMLWVFSWFLLALADLRTDLTASGIHAIFPGDQAYKNASETCTKISSSIDQLANLYSVNQRLLFHPAAITYPSSIYQLSEIIKIGTSNHLGVAARSGGVSSLFCLGFVH